MPAREPDPRDVLILPAPPPDAVVSYGPHADHVADVRLPLTGSAPLVVVIHGGFWRAEYDRSHTGHLAAALVAEGYPVAQLEYRRTGPGADGGWPTTFDDVVAGLAALPALVASVAAALGRPAPAAGAPVLIGHSAGGHLALWYAAHAAAASVEVRPGAPAREAPTAPGAPTTPTDVPPGAHAREAPTAPGAPATPTDVPPGAHARVALTVPAAVLALAPVADLAEAHRLDLDGGAVAALLGGDPTTRAEAYAAAEPLPTMPLRSPTVIVHGTADVQVPISLSRRYAAAGRAAGSEIALSELPNVGHFELIDPRSAAWRKVTEALRSLHQ
ncbi:alpha/beta fold hydrolase [Asanoa sp. NPDC049573]|uniref:alpha/beta fold hydrolase n=1 Tax=Asanoa sp. NPDC049573 TaxID=3155396 RepID=UPI00342614C7